MLIVDAHLDLSYNAICGRAVDQPARQQPPDEQGIPTVGLPDLRAGNVRLVCATVFCEPQSPAHPGYQTADEAHGQLVKQLNWYKQQEAAGTMRFVRSREEVLGIEMLSGGLHPSSLPDYRARGPEVPAHNAPSSVIEPTRAIFLLEGADPIRNESDLLELFQFGLRIIGMAWRQTRFAGGTGQPGPLTAAGVELAGWMDKLGIIHDASHLAEQSFWQLLDITSGPVIASHSNCRAIVPTDRQLSDEMIRAISARSGMIGINFFDKFLLSPDEYGKRRARLADVCQHIRHMCDCIGDADHVGLGTDMDGGLGREQIPMEIETSADLPRVGEALSNAGFADLDVAKILGGNWMRLFSRHLADAA